MSEKKKGLFARLFHGLGKTRDNMTEKVDTLVRETRKIDDDFYDELEDILILSDCGMKATMSMMDELREQVKAQKVTDAAVARDMLKEIMVKEMDIPRPPLKWPMVMLIVGVNGVGKTTTIGKLALRFQQIGRKVMLAAGDTFRAAAAEQLTVWAQRARVPIVKHEEGADPAAVVYDAIQSAKANEADVIFDAVDQIGKEGFHANAAFVTWAIFRAIKSLKDDNGNYLYDKISGMLSGIKIYPTTRLSSGEILVADTNAAEVYAGNSFELEFIRNGAYDAYDVYFRKAAQTKVPTPNKKGLIYVASVATAITALAPSA